MRCLNFHSGQRKLYRRSPNNSLIVSLLWILTFSQLLAHSFGFFFPLFANFLNRFKGNPNHNNHFSGGENGGISLFNNGVSGNATSIRVPMLHSVPERRVDVLTTITNQAERDEPQIKIFNNVSTTAVANAILSSRLVVPTSTSVTSSISARHPHHQPFLAHKSSTLTLPFTPNLFGMMSYVQAMKDIKRNYKVQEKERQIQFLNKEAGDDFMTRILRTLIQKVVNKYQKQTEILKLKILKRQSKLQQFLQLPMVAGVIASEQAANIAGQPVALGKDGVSIVGAVPSGKRIPSILDSFLI